MNNEITRSWVNEKTNGKIKEIIPGSANPETRVILANALYFNAEWQETFIEGATGFKKFYPNGKDSDYSIMVELMAHGGKRRREFLTTAFSIKFAFRREISALLRSRERLRNPRTSLQAKRDHDVRDNAAELERGATQGGAEAAHRREARKAHQPDGREDGGDSLPEDAPDQQSLPEIAVARPGAAIAVRAVHE